jgi:hypothetical protein
VFDEEEDHAAPEQEEDVLRQRVRRPGVPERVDDRSDDEKDQGGADRIAGVERGPHGVHHVGE